MPTPHQLELKELRRRLAAYLHQAQQNERKLRRFQDQELQLIGAAGLGELLDVLLRGHRRTFGLDASSLVLVDADHELRHILQEAGAAEYPGLMFRDDPDTLAPLFPDARPVLGRYRPERDAPLFHGCREVPASVALLPLWRGERLIGCLTLGSRAEQRFIAGTATDFLQRLAAVAAICLENAANSERLKRVGLTDPLTGVHNRRYFDQRLLEESDRALRQHRPLSCLFLDIDHFKRINDGYGHAAGDEVLRAAAAILKAHMRASDVLGRYGGEEFAALLVQTDAQAAREIAERIRAAVAGAAFDAGAQRLEVTLSIGCATLEGDGHREAPQEAAASLLARADAALYRAKQAGRNRVAEHGPVEN